MLNWLRRIWSTPTQSRAIPRTYGELFGLVDAEHKSLAGENVTVQKLFGLPAFFQAVELISGDVAKLPLNRYTRDGEDRVIDSEHVTHKVVRRGPNYFQNRYNFWRQLLAQRLIYQKAFAKIERDKQGNAIELLPLLSDRTEIVHKGRQLYVVTEVNNRLFPIPYDDVFHLQGVSVTDFVNNSSLAELAKDCIGEMLATRGFSSRFFKNGARVGGVLELPLGTTKKTADALEEGFRKTYESNDAPFKTIIAREGAKFHAAQLSPSDMQMVEVRDAAIISVASLFNVPPHKLGHSGRTSFASLEQENRSYYDNCLSHYLQEIVSECDFKLRTTRETERDQVFYDYNIHALNWADVSTVSTVASNGIINSWLTPNEARKWFNLPQIEGGDSLIQQLNTTQITPQPDTQAQQDAVRAVYNETAIRACNRIGIQLKKNLKQNRDLFDGELTSAIDEMMSASVSACRALGIKVDSSSDLIAEFMLAVDGSSDADIDLETKLIRSRYE